MSVSYSFCYVLKYYDSQYWQWFKLVIEDNCRRLHLVIHNNNKWNLCKIYLLLFQISIQHFYKRLNHGAFKTFVLVRKKNVISKHLCLHRLILYMMSIWHRNCLAIVSWCATIHYQLFRIEQLLSVHSYCTINYPLNHIWRPYPIGTMDIVDRCCWHNLVDIQKSDAHPIRSRLLHPCDFTVFVRLCPKRVMFFPPGNSYRLSHNSSDIHIAET